MKPKSHIVSLILLVLTRVWASNAQSLTAFQNLNFEQANLSAIPITGEGGLVAIDLAMPGWMGFIGTQATSQVLQNNFYTGDAGIMIEGPNWGTAEGIIAGKYTAGLISGGAGQYQPATLSQTGLVPLGAASLQIKLSPGATGFAISLASQPIRMIPLLTASTYTVYGGAIPAGLAGTEANLSISALPTAQSPRNGFYFDDLAFSASPVPEPETGWLLLTGGAALGIAGRLADRAKRSGATKAPYAAGEPNTFAE